MTEAELLMLQIELLSHSWTVLFTWIGTTTGMVAAAYFAASRFSVSLITGMLGLYSLFTAACSVQLLRFWGRMQAIRKDLHVLEERGIELSYSSQVLAQNIDSEQVRIAVELLVLTIFFVSIGYVIYCFRKGRE